MSSALEPSPVVSNGPLVSTNPDDADETLLRDVQLLQREARRSSEAESSRQVFTRNRGEAPLSSINSLRGRVRRNASGNPRRHVLTNNPPLSFQHSSNQFPYWKIPGLYSVVSAALAAIAILTSPQHSGSVSSADGLFGFLWTPLNLPAPTTNASEEKKMDFDEKLSSKTFDLVSHQKKVLSTTKEDMKISGKISGTNAQLLDTSYIFQRFVGTLDYLESILSARLTAPGIEMGGTNDGTSANWLSRIGSTTSKRQNGKLSRSAFNEIVEAVFSPFSEATVLTCDSSLNKSMQSSTNRISDVCSSVGRTNTGNFDLLSFLRLGNKKKVQNNSEVNKPHNWLSFLYNLLDAKLFNPNEISFTDLFDKILTSTPRLLAIINFFMALTFLIHQGVAEWFLGTPTQHWPSQRETAAGQTFSQLPGGQHQTIPAPDWSGGRSSTSSSSASRERLGGFLLFKLLLISAVVKTDMFDLLILLSWYTLVGFLRSLVSLCAQSIARTTASLNSSNATAGTTNTRRRSQLYPLVQPHSGVLQLLLTVLVWDAMAVAVCVALFHKAGFGMVVLLTCDCAVLALDIICQLLRHRLAVVEVQHVLEIRKLEEEQLQYTQHNQEQQNVVHEEEVVTPQSERDSRDFIIVDENETNEYSVFQDLSESYINDESIDPNEVLQRIDRRMESLEQQHLRRTNSIESSIFTVLLFSQILTIFHFCHIWSLDSIQLTLIDGVLALQLHSAIATASHKISERRNLKRMDAAMNSKFEDASVLDLKNAAAAGDVCCICLGTMSVLEEDTNVLEHSSLLNSSKLRGNRNLRLTMMGTSTGSKERVVSSKVCSHVKKLSCGHLYHTSCLREVVERASSLATAKCPLCRTPMISSRYQTLPSASQTAGVFTVSDIAAVNGIPLATDTASRTNQGDDNNSTRVVAAVGSAEPQDALFRFSTEGLLPAWLPFPAFSFEVVRRLPRQPSNRGVGPRAEGDTVQGIRNPTSVIIAATDASGTGTPDDDQQLQPQPRESWLRRFFVAAGIVPHTLTPQEEVEALEHLSEMFPQYDRAELLYCLRRRGSAEAAARMILDGIFLGIPGRVNPADNGGTTRQISNEVENHGIINNNENVLSGTR